MNAMIQAASAYRQASTTVSPGMAIVRLYDQVLMLIGQGVQAIEERRLDVAHQRVSRAATVLRGLRGCLDFEKGGAMAEMLSRMYTSNILALHTSFGRPDQIERYRKLAAGLADMRDAWIVVVGSLPQRG